MEGIKEMESDEGGGGRRKGESGRGEDGGRNVGGTEEGVKEKIF